MSAASAAECRMDAYVVRHRQSGPRVRQSEAPGPGQPERLRIVGLVEIELFVLEADVHPLEHVEPDTAAPGKRAVAFVLAHAAERRGNFRQIGRASCRERV